MPLEILIPLIVTGLIAVFCAVHFSGGSEAAGPMDEKLARERYLVDFPDDTIKQTLLARDGKSALLILSGTDDFGLVRRVGQHLLTRRLPRRAIRSIEPASGRIDFFVRDFTIPGLIFFGETEMVASLQTGVNAIQGTDQ